MLNNISCNNNLKKIVRLKQGNCALDVKQPDCANMDDEPIMDGLDDFIEGQSPSNIYDKKAISNNQLGFTDRMKQEKVNLSMGNRANSQTIFLKNHPRQSIHSEFQISRRHMENGENFINVTTKLTYKEVKQKKLKDLIEEITKEKKIGDAMKAKLRNLKCLNNYHGFGDYLDPFGSSNNSTSKNFNYEKNLENRTTLTDNSNSKNRNSKGKANVSHSNLSNSEKVKNLLGNDVLDDIDGFSGISSFRRNEDKDEEDNRQNNKVISNYVSILPNMNATNQEKIIGIKKKNF